MKFHVKLRGWTQIWKSPLGGYIAPSFTKKKKHHFLPCPLFPLFPTSFVSLTFFSQVFLPFLFLPILSAEISASNLPPNLSCRRLTGRNIQTAPELRRELRKLPAQAQHFGLGASVRWSVGWFGEGHGGVI